MSGFDENPFADPSVQNATSSSGGAPGGPGAGAGDAAKTATLDDYNPFEKKATTAAANGNDAPAVMSATTTSNQQAQPPPYEASGQQGITTADFQRRQEELERRARELERREAELRNTPYNARANNWPPLPSFCPVQPCFYQDINVDIPVEFQKIVKYLYYLWVANMFLLLMNMIVGLLYLFAGGDYGGTFGLALIYFCLFTPASFMCWFRPAYKAFRDDSSFNFMVFFFVFFFQFLMSVAGTLGIGNTGSCGLITGIAEVTGGESGARIFIGILMLITALGFGIMAAACFFMLVRIHRLYRGTGGSLAKAQAEFTSGVMQNETVRAAAADAATAGARAAFTQAAQGGQPGQPGGQQPPPAAGGSRY